MSQGLLEELCSTFETLFKPTVLHHNLPPLRFGAVEIAYTIAYPKRCDKFCVALTLCTAKSHCVHFMSGFWTQIGIHTIGTSPVQPSWPT